MPDFAHVGSYGAYIWPAYALTAAALVWMVADSLLRARTWRAKAEGRRAEGRKARKEP
jgi:heme exporter protein D